LLFYFIAPFCPKTTKNTLFLVLLYKYCYANFASRKSQKSQNNMNGLFEILSNKEWMIQQEFLHSILPTLQYNITNHASLGIDREKKSPMAIGQQGQDFIREYQVTQDGKTHSRYGWRGDSLSELNEPFVNVMPVDGPITRNGGACSYGSMEIRDWMMEAANNPACQGHVLTVNTPGGSAWAKNDFQQGIDYAHARGQRVIAFIDGLCASAGMYLASLCDEVYVMNPKDQLGCVGVMAAFFTMKNGDKDLSTGETYHEYYATKSINKNKEMRDIAENDDAKLLIEELDNLEAEFRADMKAAFPNAKDEHLDGKVFDAKDVMGILCDGEMMLGDIISRVFNLANGTEQPIERTANRKIAKRSKAGSGEPMQQALAAGEHAAQQINNILSNKNNSINMKEQFPAVFALLGVEEMQLGEEGTFFNKDLLATLNAAIEAKNQENADAQALVQSLTQEKENLTQQVNDLNSQVETLNAEHTKAIEDLSAAHTTAIEEKDNQISALEQEKADLQAKVDENATSMETLNAELTTAKESLTTAQNTIAERDQQISDLNATIDEMKQEPGEGAQGGSPANNGAGADGLHQASDAPQWDPTLSATENKQRMEAYEADLKKRMC